jgi:hypothetical protein
MRATRPPLQPILFLFIARIVDIATPEFSLAFRHPAVAAAANYGHKTKI